jgi:uncharacterized membrane protein
MADEQDAADDKFFTHIDRSSVEGQVALALIVSLLQELHNDKVIDRRKIIEPVAQVYRLSLRAEGAESFRKALAILDRLLAK